MRPTDVLMNEHRVIEQVLECLGRIADESDAQGRLDAGSARAALDFFRTFADRCHHGKEEDQLFPLLERRGFPREQGPVAVMRAEHERGRALIRGMDRTIEPAAAGEATACGDFRAYARGYVTLLREHIEKEDHCLFPMADQALGEADQRELAEGFERVERLDLGPETHARYVALADELAERYGVAKAGVAACHGCCGDHS